MNRTCNCGRAKNDRTQFTMKVIAAILFFVTLSAHAEEPGIFGFVFGNTLNLPECPYRIISGASTKQYDSAVSSTCIRDAHSLRGYGQPVREITFSPKECPSIVKNGRAFPLESSGKLIGIHFLTPGVESQELVMQQLVEKFGKPNLIKNLPVKNSSSAIFSSIEAHWRTSGQLSVTYYGTNGRMDYGEVFVDSPMAAMLRQTWK